MKGMKTQERPGVAVPTPVDFSGANLEAERTLGGRVFRDPARSSIGILGALAVLLLASCGGGGSDGEVHALGEQAAVGHVEYTDSGGRGVSTTVGITVLAVRQGTQEEIKANGLEVDPEDQSTTPYYVDVRYENQGEETVTRNIDASLEDSDGNLIGSTLIFNYGDKPYEPCVNVTKGEFAPGDTYESCTLILVPEGVDVGKVSFLSDKGADVEPEFVYWETE
jgi:hypothetical protein